MKEITVITGGQTGVDRGALDAALDAGARCGGWCPPQRKAEDGCIPKRYPLQALARGGYRARTRKNVEDSDATLVITFGAPTGGTAQTIEFCRELGKPLLIVDAGKYSVDEATRETLAFVSRLRVARLNVAGPRASREPRGHDYAYRVLRSALARMTELACAGSDAGGRGGCVRSARTASAGRSTWAQPPEGKRGKAESVIEIRSAGAGDIRVILRFIRELAQYERLEHEVLATEEDLGSALFGERPYAEVVLACCGGEPVGFALFFHNFSTFKGRPGLYLEDLYVRPQSRGRGVGKGLLRWLARTALERGCARLEWAVLDWNKPSIGFYRGVGATPMQEWRLFRLTGMALERLAAERFEG